MGEDTMKNSAQLEARGKFRFEDICELLVETEFFNLTRAEGLKVQKHIFIFDKTCFNYKIKSEWFQ